MTANHGNFDWSTDPETALRMQMAQGLMQGRRPPAQSWGEGLANAGSQMLGAYMARQAMDDGRAREQGRNDTLARALQAGQGRAAETKSYGDGTAINWNEQKADPKLMASILAGNRDTAPMGLQMQLGEIDAKRKSDADLAKALLDNDLAIRRDRAKPLDIGGDHRWWTPDAPGQAPAPQAAPQAAPPAGPDLRTAPNAPNPPPDDRQALAAALAGSESGGRGPGVVNRQGYSGKYQFGEAAASAAGFYEPDDNPNDNKWNGTFKGLDGVNSYQDFLRNPAAQDRAFDMHQTHLGAEIEGRGLDRYIGQTVGGVPVTRDGLIGMMHLGGPAGTQKFLETGGQYNPADGNGTRLSDYGTKFAGAQPPAAPPRVQVADASGAIPQGALAPQQGPERLTVGGRSGTVVGGPSGPKFRDLTADEVAQRGLPRGTVAQVGRDGQVHVLNKGTDGGGGPFGGPGEKQQNRNLYIRLQTKVANGEALTPQEQLSLDLIQQDAQKTQTIMTDQGLAQVPGAPLPTMGGRQTAPAAAPAPGPAADTVPNPLQAATPPAAQPEVRIIQPKASPKPSNEQNLNAGFANRLNASNSIFDGLESEGYVNPSLKDRAASHVPVVGGYLESNNFQKMDQAQREFINAQLRRESGAAISDGEFENARRQYFPQPGDGPDVLAQKRASREMALANMAQSAGPAELGFKPKPAPKAGDTPAAPTTIMRFDAEGNLIQ